MLNKNRYEFLHKNFTTRREAVPWITQERGGDPDPWAAGAAPSRAAGEPLGPGSHLVRGLGGGGPAVLARRRQGSSAARGSGRSTCAGGRAAQLQRAPTTLLPTRPPPTGRGARRAASAWGTRRRDPSKLPAGAARHTLP